MGNLAHIVHHRTALTHRGTTSSKAVLIAALLIRQSRQHGTERVKYVAAHFRKGRVAYQDRPPTFRGGGTAAAASSAPLLTSRCIEA